MQHVQYEQRGPVGLITLRRGKANAINLEMVHEMERAFDQAERESAAIVWASDRPRFFSGGFDVKEVFAYDRATMTDFLRTFSGLQQRVLHSARPTVAALSGQTYAGGAILALSCDFRVMAQGAYGLALTEINIGVTLPPSIFWLLANAVGVSHARRMFLTGEPMMAEQLAATGAVCELCPEAEVPSRAIAWAERLAAKPPAVYAAIKRLSLAETGLGRTADRDALVVDVDAWFTPEAEEFKLRLAQSLQRPGQ